MKNVQLRMLGCAARRRSFLAFVPAFGQDTSTARWEGRTISRIEFDPPQQPLTPEGLADILPLKPGTPLRMEQVRRENSKNSLLHRPVRRRVSIDAREDGPDVALRISTEFNYFISGVNIDGEREPPNRNQLITASKLELGALFVESDVDQALVYMQEKLRANGLYGATIKKHVDQRADTEEANVYFELESGYRAHFDGIELAGVLNTPKKSVIKATGWRRSFWIIPLPGWHDVTESRIQTGLEESLRKDFQKGDRLEAKVNLDKLDYHSDSNTATHLSFD